MTTTQDKKNEFRPRKLVPVGESIIVHYSGKPPKPSVRKYNGEDITEVTFWLGIADKNYPELIGQYHRFVVRPWISPARTIEVDGKPKTIQASKLHKTIQAIAGDAKVNEFARHDASLDINAPEFDPDHPDFVGEDKRSKAIKPEMWKALRGFYVAVFKEPRKDKETGEYRMAEDGGVFWQEVLELKPLKFARIFNKEQLNDSIIWPPPEPKAEKKTAPQTPPQEERPVPPPPEPISKVVDNLRAYVQLLPEYTTLAKAFLRLKGVERVGALSEQSQRHMLVLMKLREHAINGGSGGRQVEEYLKTKRVTLHELPEADSIFLLAAADHDAASGVTF